MLAFFNIEENKICWYKINTMTRRIMNIKKKEKRKKINTFSKKEMRYQRFILKTLIKKHKKK